MSNEKIKLKGQFVYRYQCGLPIWDEDGEFEDWETQYSGEIKTTSNDPDIIESLCVQDYNIKKYGEPDPLPNGRITDGDVDAILDTLYYEKETA